MIALPRATTVARQTPASDHIDLTYDARFLRRKRLESAGGIAFLVDLPETSDIRDGDALVLEDGRRIGVRAAPEPLLEIRGDLPRLAWHIGNRHTPCQIEPDRLLIRADHVLAKMLAGLGAEVREVTAPFTPEGGAYGHGRTMGHSHGHDHDPAHEH
ncbi:urease accessory protein UreE [Tranquillimonas alkanivorans]|uniref:Urease accessory protein UreE n=1 Tax=Tranquillimonas alkanivorans TaxID=441119 RepID=A0A1I5R744_9RHOB|nr:urease accessory protein UreE [Tranquillimonas alkanivorans]SFP54111.1 urease accessory protein [Tranquillimonas alkanivorans]